MFYSVYPKINSKYSYSSFDDLVKDFESILTGKDFKNNFYNSKHVTFDKESNMFTVTTIVPGFKKNQLDIQYSNNTLTLKSLEEGALGNKVDAVYTIPASTLQKIDNDAISATLEDGILTVKLPVKESSYLKKKIDIS